MVKKSFFSIFIILNILVNISLNAQKGKEIKGNEAYEAGEYYKAIEIYKDAYQNMPDKERRNEVLFRIANCYRLIGDSKQAEIYFSKCIKKEYPNPIIYFYYAEQLKMNGKYDEAIEQYNKYKELVPDNQAADAGITSCRQAKEWISKPTPYQIQDMKFFNTKAREFAPAYASADYSVVYFTSDRDESLGKLKHGATGSSFSDIYQSIMDRKGKWSTPIPLSENINTEFDEGACSFSRDFSTMYFTRCPVDKKSKMGCQIYKSNRSGEDWEKAQVIKISEDSIVAAHPAISADNLTLYFVSDMPGGFGGKDIWKITRNSVSEDFGQPENLGNQINSEWDEVFPYIHADGTLYFSSNRPSGMGGLDIYLAKKNDNGDWEIENMKFPINSSADDFGIVFEAEKERGYFSSNRKTGEDNIYSFYLPPLKFSITGIVKDSKTDNIIPNATIKLIGSDGTTLTTETQNDGTFKFNLKSATDYIFVASKKGYLNGKAKESTKGYNESTDFKSTIYLASTDKPIVVPNIFYDFGKWELRPESMVALDNLVDILRDNPNITIELRSHTDCRGTEDYNLDLSQKRAQSVVDYLISKGIPAERLTAKGYGFKVPAVVDKKITEKYPYFKEGDVLTCQYIEKLTTEEQRETAHYLNRRTEFQVIRTDYGVK